MSDLPRRAPGRTLTLPPARGPISGALFDALRSAPGTPIEAAHAPAQDILADDDAQLALYVAYELHYAAVAGVEEGWEWSPQLIAFRGGLERRMEAQLRAGVTPATRAQQASVGDTLQRLVQEDDGPPLSRFLETAGLPEHVLEHVIHRSAYQLKEADPHSWAIPRLTGGPKVALLEVQYDEYGGGRPERMHSELFARTMRGLGLDPAYGAYLELLPGLTLATVNLVTMFGLHRRLRGALAGHLAVFEMTSAIPNRRYGNALRRLGHGPEVTGFYDEHVEADAVHESVAAWDLADALARAEPQTAAEILFGARALLALEGRWAGSLLDAFRGGRSSLLTARRAAAA